MTTSVTACAIRCRSARARGAMRRARAPADGSIADPCRADRAGAPARKARDSGFSRGRVRDGLSAAFRGNHIPVYSHPYRSRIGTRPPTRSGSPRRAPYSDRSTARHAGDVPAISRSARSMGSGPGRTREDLASPELYGTQEAVSAATIFGRVPFLGQEGRWDTNRVLFP